MPAMVDGLNTGLRRVPEWPLYVVMVIPPAVLLYLGITGGLGVEPIEVMEHQLGRWGIQALIATLLVTPLRRYAGINLLKFRRAFGLIAFFYICLHLTVWVVLDMSLLWAQILEDLTERWYIIIGMTALATLVPLALTSTKRAMRRMGRTWNKLHLLVYPAALLGAAHYVMQEKVFDLEAWIYASVIAVLVGLRLVWRLQRQHRAAA